MGEIYGRSWMQISDSARKKITKKKSGYKGIL